jgi:hypothetical protein
LAVFGWQSDASANGVCLCAVFILEDIDDRETSQGGAVLHKFVESAYGVFGGRAEAWWRWHGLLPSEDVGILGMTSGCGTHTGSFLR